jgi:hypothetical protein
LGLSLGLGVFEKSSGIFDESRILEVSGSLDESGFFGGGDFFGGRSFGFDIKTPQGALAPEEKS